MKTAEGPHRRPHPGAAFLFSKRKHKFAYRFDGFLDCGPGMLSTAGFSDTACRCTLSLMADKYRPIVPYRLLFPEA